MLVTLELGRRSLWYILIYSPNICLKRIRQREVTCVGIVNSSANIQTKNLLNSSQTPSFSADLLCNMEKTDLNLILFIYDSLITLHFPYPYWCKDLSNSDVHVLFVGHYL
jgi:hypothetical protein